MSRGNEWAAVLDTVVNKSIDLFAIDEIWLIGIVISVMAYKPQATRLPGRDSKAVDLKSKHGGIFVRIWCVSTLHHVTVVFFAVYRPQHASTVTTDLLVDVEDTVKRVSSLSHYAVLFIAKLTLFPTT